VAASVPTSNRIEPDSDLRAPGERPRSWIPGWLFSLALHGTVFTVLGLSIKPAVRGSGAEATRDGGIVLTERSAGRAEYFSPEEGTDAPSGSAATAAAAEAAQAASDALPAATLPPGAGNLPQLPEGTGPLTGAPLPGDGIASAAAMAATGAGGTGGGRVGQGGKFDVETKVFGVAGRGSRFVYVFDRSTSMDQFGGRPLLGAKRELIASLQSLESVHQFQIIFYNENPRVMNLAGTQRAEMIFGNDQGKKLAEQFVGGIYADGGTRHLEALKLALRMGPDVIFFLTDADEPQLKRHELDEIRRLNRGTVINAIEFGIGQNPAARSFLKVLAAENDGQHGYVDVTRLPK
jgi:hypothetical protein